MVERHSDVATEGTFLTCTGWRTAYLFMNVERQVTSATLGVVELVRNLVAHGDAREGK